VIYLKKNSNPLLKQGQTIKAFLRWIARDDAGFKNLYPVNTESKMKITVNKPYLPA
jgi:hypothetical protein